MAEYVGKEAAMLTPVLPKEHRRYQTSNLDDVYAQGWADALDNLKNAPEDDVVPVVRCKDCKYGEAYYRMDGTKGIYCHCPHAILHYGIGSIFTPVREALDFCSYGKRKDGDGNG